MSSAAKNDVVTTPLPTSPERDSDGGAVSVTPEMRDVILDDGDVTDVVTSLSRTDDEDDSHSTYSAQSESLALDGRCSSMSMSFSSSMTSRIPRLNRTYSLKERRNRNGLRFEPVSNISVDVTKANSQPESTLDTRCLRRSASFASSRGYRASISPQDLSPKEMLGIPPSGTPSSGRATSRSAFTSPTVVRRNPEDPKRSFYSTFSSQYVSPYSRKAIDRERRTQSSAASMFTSQRSLTLGHISLPANLRTFSPKHLSINSPTEKTCTVSLVQNNFTQLQSNSQSNSPLPIALSPDVLTYCHHQDDRGRGGGGASCSSNRSSNILHCPYHLGGINTQDYLTPTQRATKNIVQLKTILKAARQEIAEKDMQISSLNKQLLDLKLVNSRNAETRNRSEDFAENSNKRKNSPSSCPAKIRQLDEHDIALIGDDLERPKSTLPPVSPVPPLMGSDSDPGELSRSLADSGHYEDMPSPCDSHRDSFEGNQRLEEAHYSSPHTPSHSLDEEEEKDEDLEDEDDFDLDIGSDSSVVWSAVMTAEKRVMAECQLKVEELKRNQMEEYQELKERHNDKVEALLAKLSDANLKYFELRPQCDKSLDRCRDLENELLRVKDELLESEMKHQKIYLQMYLKGQQSSRISKDEEKLDRFDMDELSNDRLINTLMHQLAQSEEEILRMKENLRPGSSSTVLSREDADPAVILQFLKSAIYYYLTDKDNNHGHLSAIMSILGYSSKEKAKISHSTRR